MSNRRYATLLVLGASFLAIGCTRRLPRREPTVARRPTFDRSSERREVLSTVLAEYRGVHVKRLVVDTTLEPPDGSGEPRDVAGAREETKRDWKAQARPKPAPEDLRADVPIEWFSQARMEALAGGKVFLDDGSVSLEELWRLFHVRYPDSAGWIFFSDVGFSPSGDEALLCAGSQRGSLDGSGRWLLLRKVAGRWTIVAEETAWVS